MPYFGIGITINNILRDHISKLKDLYEFEFEKQPIEPINPFDLSKSFPDIDGEVTFIEFKPDNEDIELVENKKDGSFFYFNENAVSLINKQGKFIATRIIGPLPKLLRDNKFIKVASIGSGFY